MNSILVSLLDNLGDVVMSISALQIIRDNFPGVKIGVLVRPETAVILQNNPVVDVVLVYHYRSKSFLPGMGDIIAKIRAQKFDVYLSLDRRSRAGVVALLSRIKTRIGPDLLFAGAKPKLWTSICFNKTIPMAREELASTGESFRLLVRRALGVSGNGHITLPPLPAASVEKAASVFEGTTGPRIGLSVKANFELKNWPPEKFAALMTRLKDNHGATLYITGAPGDRDYVDNLLTLCPPGTARNLAGETGIMDVVALAAGSDLFITLDTGALHLAANSGLKNVIAIFCCTTPVVVRDSIPHIVVMWSGEDCNPCQDVRPDECTNRKCMDNVTVDMVYAEAERLLRQSAAGGRS